MHQHHEFQGKFLGLLGVIYFLGPPVGDNDRVWSLRFYREFNDWELVASYSLLHFIQTLIPRGGGSEDFVGDSMEVGSLMFGISIIRFEM